MATFPQGLTTIDKRCNSGERAVLHQLKRLLPDDHLVWHDVPIGPRARQPDFVVLSPRQGLLVLEVKHWKHQALHAIDPDRVELQTVRGRVTQANPLRQARDYVMELVDLMACDPALVHAQGAFKGKLLLPYGWGVVFSGIGEAQVAGSDFHRVFARRRVLLREQLDESVAADDFLRWMWGLFTVHYPHTLTLPQRDRIRWHLFPEVRVTQGTLLAQDEPAAPLPELLQVMDLQQEQIARVLGEGHRVIHGPAGSGKTMILVFRAQQLAAAASRERPVLVLCFNRVLSQRIERMLAERGVRQGVVVRTFHAWCADLVRAYQLDVPSQLKGEAYFEALAAVVERAVETGFVPGGQYSALLIDEAHDFEDAWLRVAAQMVDPATRSLLVLYDDAQSIYQKRRRAFTFASVGIQAQGRTTILKLNYRNTHEVLAVAMHCAESILREQLDESAGTVSVHPATAGRRGPMPILIEATDPAQEAELVAERVAGALAAGHDPDDVLVLARTRQRMQPLAAALRARRLPVEAMCDAQFSRFDWRRPAVRVMTLHSAKGLESPLVVLAGLDAMTTARGASPEDEVRLLYVGMTRATQSLVLSTAGPGGMSGRVRQSLQAVATQLAH